MTNQLNKTGKLIIFSAPSGAGKSTIVQHLISNNHTLEFSISATSRQPRGQEINGKDYYFLTPDEFRKKIANNEFLEWEEVYTDNYYGTLLSEVERITNKGHHILFDVDVIGGINIKKRFGAKAISFFVMPPSIDELKNRLIKRGTDTIEKIEIRIAKAAQEISVANQFDVIVTNDNLNQAISEVETQLNNFISNT